MFRVGAVLLAGGVCCGCTQSDTPQVATARTGSPVAQQSRSTIASVLDDYISAQRRLVDCLRRNGLSNQPDPDQYGRVDLDTRSAPLTAIQQARTACQSFVVPPPVEIRDLWDRQYADSLTDAQKKVIRDYAKCMQTHGASDFPDPNPDGTGGEGKWDQTAPGVRAAQAACAPIIGDPADPGPGVG